MDDKERAIEEGLAIKELERQEGWTILVRKIKAESLALFTDMKRIELEGRSLSDIGSEYVSIIQRANGLERVLEIVEKIKEAAAQANKQHE